MKAQPSIRQTLHSDHGRKALATMTPEDLPGRVALARRVCRHFDFVDRTGKFRQSGNLAVLRDLETTGTIRLSTFAGQQKAELTTLNRRGEAR